MDTFRGTISPEASALRDRIPSELAIGVRGDFVTLGYNLEEIKTARTVRQTEEILDRANETREDAIAREIKNLNQTLSREEIDEVNEMLNWIMGAMEVGSLGWVDTKCLQGLLLLKTETAALVSLATQITSNYGALLQANESEFVTLVSDNIGDYLLVSSRDDRQIQHSNVEVQETEVAIIKRVVNTFCGDDLYRRFNFEKFFDSIGGEKALRIDVDEDAVHIKIILACLIALCDKHDDKDLIGLHDYARIWLFEHLKKIDLDSASEVALKEIGPKLCKLLMEPAFIDACKLCCRSGSNVFY